MSSKTITVFVDALFNAVVWSDEQAVRAGSLLLPARFRFA